MSKTTAHEARSHLPGDAPFGERVAAQTDQPTEVDEGVGSNHPADPNLFPFPSLGKAKAKMGKVGHKQPARAMPCRAITRRELARFIAALQD